MSQWYLVDLKGNASTKRKHKFKDFNKAQDTAEAEGMFVRSDDCGHDLSEDCMICSICGRCSESLDGEEKCSECAKKLHEGCKCAECDKAIEDEEDGTSTPFGSMHNWCADKSEEDDPSMW